MNKDESDQEPTIPLEKLGKVGTVKVYNQTYVNKLQNQIEKIGKALIDLLEFEGYLEPYMYECDEIRNGDLLEPFNDARKLLNSYKCRKCKGTGYVLTKKWKDKVTCPTCNGNCYIFRK